MNVVLPEFDGRINTVADQLQGGGRFDERLGTPVKRYVPGADRVDFVARLARSLGPAAADAQRREASRDPLRQLPDQERPDRQRRRARHSGLGDEPAARLKTAGYPVDDLPADGDALMHQLIDRCTYDEEFLTEDQLARRPGTWPGDLRGAGSTSFPPTVQDDGRRAGACRRARSAADDDGLAIPGLLFGNVFVGIQPPAALAPTRWRSTTAPTCRRRTITSPITAGSATNSGRRRRHPHGQARQPRMAPRQGHGALGGVLPRGHAQPTCPTSTRTSSTTPARAPRPSGAATRSSSTT